MMNSRNDQPSVLVTGAAGYVGRHVVTSLLDRGFAVVATCRAGGGAARIDARARIVETDILSDDIAIDSLVDASTVSVVHLAWQDGFAHNARSHMLNLSAHYRFLAALADAGVPRIAVLGTMHEVGYWEGAITEDTPTAPSSLYGIAKDALRRSVLQGLGDATELAWLRCYYIYGDDRQNRSIFTRLLEASDEGKTSFPFTTGTKKYDFIRVEELGEQIAVAATSAGAVGIINCSSGVPRSLSEMAEGFIQDNELGLTLEYGVFPDRPYDSPAVWGDATRISEIMADARLKGGTQ